MVKKTNKTEEKIVAVEEALSKTERFIEDNKRILSIIIGVIIVIVLAYFGFKKMYLAPLEEEAQSQMYMAEMYFEQDSLSRALYGDGNELGFLDIIDDYGMTKSANLAHYYAGICYLNLGEYKNAIGYLDDFNHKGQILGPMATGAIGDAYMELGDSEKAANYYMNAADENDNDFTSPTFLFKAGWTFEIVGDYKKALKVYEEIKNDYPKSYEAREIDKFISKAKALSK
jgi:tetratricopeptide (TPR) repeat protein